MFTRLFKSSMVGVVIFITSALLLLSGCVSKEIVAAPQIQLALPEDHLLVNCEVAAPPEKNLYLNQVAAGSFTIAQVEKDPNTALLLRSVENLSHREKLLTFYGLQLTQNLQACNKRLQGLRDWKTKSKAAVSINAPPSGRHKKE